MVMRLCTWGLVVTAAVAAEVAATATRFLGGALAWSAAAVGLAALVARLMPVPRNPDRVPPWVGLGLAALLLSPVLLDPAWRSLGGGRPLEFQFVFGLRNLALGACAVAIYRPGLRVAAASSLFLMLFAVATADANKVWPVRAMTAVYGVAGAAWLAAAYRGRCAAEVTACRASSLNSARLGGGRWRVAVLAAAVLLAAAVPLVGPSRVVAALGEWLPTSGGTGDYDPLARGGVNDGDEEISGDNARSTGFVESDQFLDSPLPSLYDLLSDMYEEPYKVKKRDPSVALDPNESRVRELPKPPPDNRRPNRNFSTARERPEKPRDPDARSARAIFEVAGRTPLHLRAAAYDFFDGVAWHESRAGPTAPHFRPGGSDWFDIERPFSHKVPIFARPARHEIKIAKSTKRWLPTPANTTRFRINRVNAVRFYGWCQAGVLGMRGRDVPSGVTLHTESRTVDPARLAAWGRDLRYGPEGLTQLPPGIDPRVAALAAGWARGLPPGPRQVEAVVANLRERCRLDWAATVPPGCQNPVAHFLFESRRGPDYQFAQAAAVLLRSLGYPARLVTGFYADPAHHDEDVGLTPVTKEDIHFWAELRLPDGDWLVLEPTPGYETAGPLLTWGDRLRAAWGWVTEHPVSLTTLALLAAGLVRGRRRLIGAALVCRWHLTAGGCWRRAVLRCGRLLERRWPRPAGRPVAAWARRLPAASAAPWAALYEWAAFAPKGATPAAAGEAIGVCRRLLKELPAASTNNSRERAAGRTA